MPTIKCEECGQDFDGDEFDNLCDDCQCAEDADDSAFSEDEG